MILNNKGKKSIPPSWGVKKYNNNSYSTDFGSTQDKPVQYYRRLSYYCFLAK